MEEVAGILNENIRRNNERMKTFNPYTGEGSSGDRTPLFIDGWVKSQLFVPEAFAEEPLVKTIIKHGSVQKYLSENGMYPNEKNMSSVSESLIRLRNRHDFPFWAASFVKIHGKRGGDNIPFVLNRPQLRIMLEALEQMRISKMPIRIILLKARQWGGSTLVQMYMAWLQLVKKKGLNSLIVGHLTATSIEVEDMFKRMLDAYPMQLLYPQGVRQMKYERTFTSVFGSTSIHSVPQRNCKIKVGTAENPDSARGGDYSLVHCTEVGLWKKTEGKEPEDIVQSACSGVLLAPLTMIVYESTAKGTGNFFHREYEAAKAGKSQFRNVFVPWYEIDDYRLEIPDTERFAEELFLKRNDTTQKSDREEPGVYMWKLWNEGATLESIYWYAHERRKYHEHARMASEYPSDDTESFSNSASNVFDDYLVERLRVTCKHPIKTGEITSATNKESGKECVKGLSFNEDGEGRLMIWEDAETNESEKETVANRYLTVVDVGGRGDKSDWSVIVVFDRIYMMEGGVPSVVAQWYGHIDMDMLAWKAAQISAYYSNALLVIESNTLETKDRDRDVDGDQSLFILNQIKDAYRNLYARKRSEAEVREGSPARYGFHTNVSTKPMVISMLIKAVRERLYTERDERALNEMRCYERKQNGSFGAKAGTHDDLLMTRAIALFVCYNDMPMPSTRKNETKKNAKILRRMTVADI